MRLRLRLRLGMRLRLMHSRHRHCHVHGHWHGHGHANTMWHVDGIDHWHCVALALGLGLRPRASWREAWWVWLAREGSSSVGDGELGHFWCKPVRAAFVHHFFLTPHDCIPNK